MSIAEAPALRRGASFRRAAAGALFFVALAVNACKSDKSTGPAADRDQYTLRTSNGASLPATFLQRTVRSASITLFKDGRHRFEINGGVVEAGVWEANGTALDFSSEEQILYAGTLENGTLTVQVHGPTVLVFKK